MKTIKRIFPHKSCPLNRGAAKKGANSTQYDRYIRDISQGSRNVLSCYRICCLLKLFFPWARYSPPLLLCLNLLFGSSLLEAQADEDRTRTLLLSQAPNLQFPTFDERNTGCLPPQRCSEQFRDQQPLPQAPATPLNQCNNLTRSAAQTVHDYYNLSRITVEFSPASLCSQLEILREVDEDPSNTRSFHSAVTAAVDSILFDNQAIDSPLRVAEANLVASDTGILSPSDHQVRQHLMNMLNREDSFFELLDQHNEYPPEGGESFSSNWIFALDISELGDIFYWVVVPRQTTGEVYNYGFN